MDIGFTIFTILLPSMLVARGAGMSGRGILPIPGSTGFKTNFNTSVGECIPHFTLQRDDSVIEFIPHDESEFHHWKNAIAPVVIQRDVWGHYYFKEMLGQGSYGKVYLAKSTQAAL